MNDLADLRRWFQDGDRNAMTDNYVAALEDKAERLQARVRDLEAALIPLYDAGHDVLRRVGGDPDAPGHMEMLRALAVALQDACRLAVVSAEKEEGRE